MPNQKITDLTPLLGVNVDSLDVLPIVDVSANETKKISAAELIIGLGIDLKVDENAAIVGATKTKITYDVKGLITAGADATTSDIADTTNYRYVTDAQLVIIGNTSGTNTGDNATNSQYSGLAASKQDTLVSATNIKTINSISLLGSGDLVVGGLSAITTIGAVPNANGMTIVGSTLNLQPASVSFGGVVTTAAQSFAGRKTTTSDMTINTINAGRGLASVATNTTFGFEGLNANTTGYDSVAIGYRALRAQTTGFQNTAIGRDALLSATTSFYNTAVGCNSLQSLAASRTSNTAIGQSALLGSEGSYNTGVGAFSMTAAYSGDSNCAFGYFSLYRSSSSNNCAFGDYALRYLTSGNFNTAIGSNSQISANTGAYNTSLGSYSLNACNTGGFNVAIGSNSLNVCASGNYNVAVGNQALASAVNALSNTAVGYQALFGNVTGGLNSALGYLTTATNFSGCVLLGASATATANNQFVVGSAVTVAGAVTPAVNTSTQYWNVVINGVAQKILLA